MISGKIFGKLQFSKESENLKNSKKTGMKFWRILWNNLFRVPKVSAWGIFRDFTVGIFERIPGRLFEVINGKVFEKKKPLKELFE